jgi:proteasome accessory factor C
MQYLADERRPDFVAWETLKADLGLSRDEVEADLSLINLVNFGGGTFALFAEVNDAGVIVTRDVMADLFARPARLSPLMTQALLLALDLLREAVVMDSTESLASVREKIRQLAGTNLSEGHVVVDDVMPLPTAILETLNRSLREHTIVEMEYFTPTRGRLTTRQVEPYLLFRSRDGWYLETYCLKAHAQRTFRLEFIRSARTTGQAFTPRPEIELRPRLFGSPFPSDNALAWAVVRFAADRRAYLEDRGIGYESLPDGSLRGRIPYLEEQWLAREIIRFLGDAVLEQPTSAREHIRRSAASLRTLYASDTDREKRPA